MHEYTRSKYICKWNEGQINQKKTECVIYYT